MSTRVEGVYQGTPYDVKVGDGGVSGSKKIARLVQLYTGRQVPAGPTGPMVTVSPSDTVSVLALLGHKTAVTVVEDAPSARPGSAVTGRVY